MKKKILLLTMLFAMGLTSCGDNTSSSSSSKPTTSTSVSTSSSSKGDDSSSESSSDPVTSDTSSDVDSSSESSSETTKNTKLTKEEWTNYFAKILDGSKLTHLKTEGTLTSTSGADANLTLITDLENNILYYNSTGYYSTQDMYVSFDSLESSNYYQFSKSTTDNKYHKSYIEESSSQYSILYYILTSSELEIFNRIDYDDLYDDLSYNEETNKYSVTISSTTAGSDFFPTGTNFEIGFKDNELSTIDMEYVQNSVTYTYGYTYSFNADSLTLPEYVDNTSESSDELVEYFNSFDKEKLSHAKISITENVNGTKIKGAYLFDIDKNAVSVNSSSSYVSISSYSVYDTETQKTYNYINSSYTEDDKQFNSTLDMFMYYFEYIIDFDYSEFTYDAETLTYVANNPRVTNSESLYGSYYDSYTSIAEIKLENGELAEYGLDITVTSGRHIL